MPCVQRPSGSPPLNRTFEAGKLRGAVAADFDLLDGTFHLPYVFFTQFSVFFHSTAAALVKRNKKETTGMTCCARTYPRRVASMAHALASRLSFSVNSVSSVFPGLGGQYRPGSWSGTSHVFGEKHLCPENKQFRNTD